MNKFINVRLGESYWMIRAEIYDQHLSTALAVINTSAVGFTYILTPKQKASFDRMMADSESIKL